MTKTYKLNWIWFIFVIILLLVALVKLHSISKDIKKIELRVPEIKICKNVTRAFPDVICNNQSIWEDRGGIESFSCAYDNSIRKCNAVINGNIHKITCWEEDVVIEKCTSY